MFHAFPRDWSTRVWGDRKEARYEPERRPTMLTPRIDDSHGFMIGSPHRQHWQFAVLAGLGVEVIIALTAMLLLMAAMVTM